MQHILKAQQKNIFILRVTCEGGGDAQVKIIVQFINNVDFWRDKLFFESTDGMFVVT